MACDRALKNSLYESKGWMFYELFNEPQAIIKMATAFVNRKPVGVSVYWDFDLLTGYDYNVEHRQLGCFVKEEFRRRHIGARLVHRIRAPKTARVGVGLAISRSFWPSVRPGVEFQ
jgi:hypothetical protein